ncbi:hypothetical protein [Streptomyces niveus]|uniref:hypothetical protein n=1 Tax=Streptomyces niveus TaxID=193462 RepID=UPI0037B13C91
MAEELFARVRRLVELAVAEGRRAVAEPAHGDGFSLRRTRFQVAAELTTTLTTEADRRARDAFGRLSDADPDAYAWAWLNTAVHLAATERTLIQSTWHSPAPAPLTASLPPPETAASSPTHHVHAGSPPVGY